MATTLTSAGPALTHEQTLVALQAAHDVLDGVPLDSDNLEQESDRLARAHRQVADVWTGMDIHAAPGATGILLIQARAAAIGMAQNHALRMVRVSTNSGNLRYRDAIRDAGVAYGEPV